MTIQNLIDKLSTVENKELPVMIYDHEYGSYYELETVEKRDVPDDEFYDRQGQTIIALDS